MVISSATRPFTPLLVSDARSFRAAGQGLNRRSAAHGDAGLDQRPQQIPQHGVQHLFGQRLPARKRNEAGSSLAILIRSPLATLRPDRSRLLAMEIGVCITPPVRPST